MTTITNAATAASAAVTLKQAEPIKFVERVGSTDYILSVKFTGKETINEKILRLIESEVAYA
jgi:hypothetical protein